MYCAAQVVFKNKKNYTILCTPYGDYDIAVGNFTEILRDMVQTISHIRNECIIPISNLLLFRRDINDFETCISLLQNVRVQRSHLVKL